MTNAFDRSPSVAGITVEGLGAVIPAAVLVALLARQAAKPADPVIVDAHDLRIVASSNAIADLIRQVVPDREITVTFSQGTMTVEMPGLPTIRLDFPADGLRLYADEAGLRVGGV